MLSKLRILSDLTFICVHSFIFSVLLFVNKGIEMRCFGHLRGGYRIEDSKGILVRTEPPNTLLSMFQTLSSFLVRDSRIYNERQLELAVTLVNYTRHMKSLIIVSIASVTIHYFRPVAAYTPLNLAMFTCLF